MRIRKGCLPKKDTYVIEENFIKQLGKYYTSSFYSVFIDDTSG